MLDYISIPDVDTKEKALKHLESEGVDVAELREFDRDLAIVWAAKDEGFYYPNWHGELFRSYERGDDIAVVAGTAVDSVASKDEAIEHLQSIGVDTSGMEAMSEVVARVHADVLATEAGFIYPNWRPL